MQQRNIPIYPILFALFTLIFSLIIFPFYTGGDQEHYRLFYDSVAKYSFAEGFIAYRNYLGASEPVYYLIIFIFNNLVEKDILISIVNSIFAYNVARCLIKMRVNVFVVFSILFNFYFIVLLFSAERLKFSMMFFFMSLAVGSGFKQYALLFLCVLSHLQSLMLVYVQKISQIKNELIKYFKGGNFFRIFLLVGVLLGFFFVLYSMSGYLGDKYTAYSEKAGIVNVIKPIVFCLLSIFYCQKRWFEIIAIFAPLVFASVLVGEERIVIFCYGIFFYFAAQVKRGVNFGILITNLYFIYKGIEFVVNILINGNGFDPIK